MIRVSAAAPDSSSLEPPGRLPGQTRLAINDREDVAETPTHDDDLVCDTGNCLEERSDFLATTFGARGDEEVMQYKGGGSKFPASELAARMGFNKFRMQGRKVFAFAVEKFASLIKEVCQQGGVDLKDVALVVPHQVNLRIIDSAMEKLGIPPEKSYVNIDKYGNTSAASIPIALDEAVRSGKVKQGDVVIFVAFGAGLTWANAVVRL